MLFKRLLLGTANNGGLLERSRSGAGLFANIAPSLVATDAAGTMTVDQMSGGMVQYTGLTAGRIITTPTAALIIAAAADMDIGDSFSFLVSVTTGFAVTWAAGAGVTLQGRATVPANTFSVITVTRTAAATVTWNAS